jgi:tetratricopeptide (TPR) repeat protein
VDDITTLIAAAQSSRLVIFVGAGASMGAPTNLPSWREVNRIVVRSLATSASSAIGDDIADNAAQLILARHEKEKLPPEYQAQLLAEFLHHRYFEVLRHIDSDRPNATHLAIAWLARLGCVRAVITTNFDRLLEAAFAAVDVQLERHFQPEHFRALAADLGRLDNRDGPCQLLKLHGSVDDPQTLIDTLAQRKQGFPSAVMTCVNHLLRRTHWLFLGFSGLDLEAEPNYLGLEQEAGVAAGFTWLVRAKNEPKPAVVALKQLYGERGEIVFGDLPDWLLDFISLISAEPRSWIEPRVRNGGQSSNASPTDALSEGAKAWSQTLSPNVCAMSLGFVVAACAEPQAAARLVEALLQKIDDGWAQTPEPSVGLHLMKALAANALGILLAGLGRHEEAVRWITTAIDLTTQVGDADMRDRCRGNLAVSLETLGRVDEARDMYESALAGYRTRRDPVPIAFGLTSLASHLIRQMHLGEAQTLAEEAIVCAKRAGDERLRGTALHDLGMIAKLRGDYPLALEIFAEVENLFTRLGNDEAVAAAVGNRGEVLAALGQFDEAERMQRWVLQIEETLERVDNQGATCLSLGLLNRKRGDPVAAEEWFTKALEVFRRIQDPSNQALALYRLAALKSDAQDFEEAIALATSALPLVSGRNQAFTADLWEQIGRANLKLGYVVRAEQAYREAIAVAEQLGDTNLLASCLQNLGTALLLQQRDSNAAAAFAHAANIWQSVGDQQNLEYCRLAEAAVRLDERIANLSNAGHAATDRQEQRAAAREMIALYPDLIAMYQRIGAMQLVAEFCASAASTAQFVSEDPQAVEWYRRAASVFQDVGLPERAHSALARSETLLQSWANGLLRQEQMADAVPVLLQLAEVAGQLDHREACATAMYNAAIGLLATSQDYAQAKWLAEQAAEIFDAGSDDAATARKLAAFCDSEASKTITA